jgi:ABC-2 type transport system permease protein
MRGLLLNNYYSLQNNIKSSLGIALLLSLVSFAGVDRSVLNAVIAAQIWIFVLSIGASLQMDEASKWNRFELTMPIRRKTVIHAKYLSFLMLILMGTAVSLVTLALTYVSKGDIAHLNLSTGYTFGLSLSISTLAIYYPVILKFGVEKSEQMVMISAGLSLGLRLLVWMLLNLYRDDVNFNGPETGYVTLIPAVLLFAVSYLFAVRIHRNKEF